MKIKFQLSFCIAVILNVAIIQAQEFANYYIDPTDNPELVEVNTTVFDYSYAVFGGHTVHINGNVIDVSLCYLISSFQSITFDHQSYNLTLPPGYVSYTININLYADGDDAPCTNTSLVESRTITIGNPYKPLETTFVPDDVFEMYLEDTNAGDNIVNNDFVYTHRIENKGFLFLNEWSFPLNGEVADITGIEDFVQLREFFAGNNQISTMDLSSNIFMEHLFSQSNPLSLLDLTNSPNLHTLWARHGILETIDLSQNPELTFMDISYNSLSSLLLQNNAALEHLLVEQNNIGSIDLSANVNLVEVDLSDNSLSTIDTDTLLALNKLDVSSNPIAELSLALNQNLEHLDVSGTDLITFNPIVIPNLKNISGFETPITNLDFSQNLILESFAWGFGNLESLNLRNGNNENMFVFTIDNPNLSCIDVDNPSQAPFEEWYVDSNVSYSENCALGLNDVRKDLDFLVYPNPTADMVTIQNESAELIDLIEIYNLNGDLVNYSNGSIESIDLRFLASGLYLLKIYSGNKMIVKRILKQ